MQAQLQRHDASTRFVDRAGISEKNDTVLGDTVTFEMVCEYFHSPNALENVDTNAFFTIGALGGFTSASCTGSLVRYQKKKPLKTISAQIMSFRPMWKVSR